MSTIDIGKEDESYTLEPNEVPEPVRIPAPEPERAPAKAPEREPVPA